MIRSCETCEWRRNDAGETPDVGERELCASGNPWSALPAQRWCGVWRLAERLGGGFDRRASA